MLPSDSFPLLSRQFEVPRQLHILLRDEGRLKVENEGGGRGKFRLTDFNTTSSSGSGGDGNQAGRI